MKSLPRLLAAAIACGALTAHAAPQPALDAGKLGFADAARYRLASGDCKDCGTAPAALWYFRGDTIAVPKTHSEAAGFDPALRAQEDVRTWRDAYRDKGDGSLAPLVWIGSPEVWDGARLAADGKTASDGATTLGFSIVPKLASNRSYYNAASQQFFAAGPLKLRGRHEGEGFVARSIWPRAFDLTPANTPLAPLAPGESLYSLVRAQGGGATQPFGARVLWERTPGAGTALAGKPALAFMLNGAQGDDDEAHGGHFAIATGRFGAQGQWDDWLVNNFYNLDSVSEKGIIAATLPMDAYMADLNSGQSWYRPSYMLVAVLKEDRAPRIYQEAIGRVFNHFYRHDFAYGHATANCAGVNLTTLRSLGWNIPTQGPTSRVKAVAALPYMAAKDRDLESGRKAYEYLTAEQTSLYPLVAFGAAGDDLLQRVSKGAGTAGYGLEQLIAEDVEAIVYVRIPQFPSSRAMGEAPVASIDEYMARVPEDRAQWKIIPVDPRPFPPELKDARAPFDDHRPSTYAVAGYGAVFGLGLLGVFMRVRRRRKA